MKHAHNGYRAADALAGISRWPSPAPGIAIKERMQRIEYARSRMAALGVDALLVNAGASLRYFTGIPWQASERLVAMVLPLTDPPFLVAPEFERGSLEAMLKIEAQLHCWEEHENPYRLVANELLKRKTKRLAPDPQASFMIAEGLRRAGSSLEILSGATVVDHCRMRKSPAELALIQQAMSMTLEVHRQAASILEPGISANAVRRFIDSAHHAFGADGGSTFCAVQFATATAYPHGLPGDQCLTDGDLVLIDTGCTVMAITPISPGHTSSEKRAPGSGMSGMRSAKPSRRHSMRSGRVWHANPSMQPHGRCWRAQASVRNTGCRGCRTEPVMASVCRSTNRLIWFAEIQRHWHPACVSAMNR